MTYYTISSCSGYYMPRELNPFDGEVFEKNKKNCIKKCGNDEILYDEEVYTSKKDAWKVILKNIDENIVAMQAKRQDMFNMALEDGAFILSKEEFSKWLNSFSHQQEENDLFVKRNKVS